MLPFCLLRGCPSFLKSRYCIPKDKSLGLNRDVEDLGPEFQQPTRHSTIKLKNLTFPVVPVSNNSSSQ